MYNDGTITTEFTGYYDSVEQEYVYPSSRQNFVVVFNGFYLSAEDGDFTDGGVTITNETGSTEDIAIGNATAAVLSAVMLNPNGLMDSLTFGEGKAAIGVVTDETAADTHNSMPCHILVNSHHYGITANGSAVYDNTTTPISGSPRAVVVSTDGKAYYYTDTAAVYWNGSSFTAATPLPFMANKYANVDEDEPLGIALDSMGCPAIVNNVAANKKTTTTYVPMGVFDFSNVDAFGITFSAEAYDRMTRFDADATEWLKSLDFTTPKTLSQILAALTTKMGLAYTLSASAVNTNVSWAVNPITSYTVTYRQVLKWLAEAMGCNARMSRTGTVELYTFSGTAVATVTPDTIVSNSRTKTRYAVPQITKCVCYNTVGAGYESGVDGSPYYIVGNPFIDPSGSDGLTPVTNLKNLLDDIPSYYPTSISIGCADPRIDIGDFLTVQSTDGLSTYAVPVMRQTLHWASVCTANILASGQQVRAIPNSMVDGTDLSGVVSSNPAAVVNMIEAHGIDADWITAGEISDRQHKNYWDLETGELVITDGVITATYTETIDHSEYSQEDLDILDALSSPTSDPLTDEEKLKYDIDGTGLIDQDDVDRISWMISTGNDIQRTITTTIDPHSSDKAIKITTSVPETGTVPASVIESYYSGAKTQSSTVYCDRVVFSGDTHATMIASEYDEEVSIGQPSIRPWGHSEDNVTVPNDSWTKVNDVDLPPGMWYITATARFTQSATGRRMVCVSDSPASGTAITEGLMGAFAAVNGARSTAICAGPLYVSQATHLYMNCYQNSGSSKGTIISFTCVRLV